MSQKPTTTRVARLRAVVDAWNQLYKEDHPVRIFEISSAKAIKGHLASPAKVLEDRIAVVLVMAKDNILWHNLDNVVPIIEA